MSSVAKEFRLVVVGPPVVGKSALTIRLTQSEFANEYDPTIEDSYRYYCNIDNTPASLDILDTAGQEEYSSMRDLYMKTGEGFLLVFSLTDRHTFEEISTFYNQIIRVKGETVQFVPMMLVGNKNDLIDERQVSHEEAILLAKKFNCAYIETSAKTGLNVVEAFHGLVKMVMYGDLMGIGLENTLYPNKAEELKAQESKKKLIEQNSKNEMNTRDNTNNNNNNNNKNFNSSFNGNNTTNTTDNQNNTNTINNNNNTSSNVINSDNNNSKENNNKQYVQNTSSKPSAGAKENGGGCCTIM